MLPGPAFVQFIAPVLLGLVAVLSTVLSTSLCTIPGKRSRIDFEAALLSDVLGGVEEGVYDILARLAGPRTYNMRPGIPHGTSGGVPRNRGWYHEMQWLVPPERPPDPPRALLRLPPPA